MSRRSGRARRLAIGAAFVAGFGLASQASDAQGLDCAQLRGQLASLRGNPAQAQRYLQAAARQQRELDRLQSYAQSIGCQNHQFLFFGSAAPPECQQINPRIERLRSNLAQLQQEAATVSGEARRRQLTDQYNSYCGNGTQADLRRPRSFFEQLFGGQSDEPAPPTTDVPINPNPEQAPSQGPTGGSKAVCVRICNGSFFPISYVATPSQYPALQEKCDVQSPGAKTELFTMPETGVIDQAVSADGQPYSSLPNADAFEHKYDASCSSRPPNESWAQALANAESLSGGSHSDIIVTPEKSEQLSRLVSPEPAKSTKGAGKSRSGASASDDETAVDIANTADAPTIGQESADIAGSTVKGKFYGENQGRVVEEPGPNGVTRHVRIIGQ